MGEKWHLPHYDCQMNVKKGFTGFSPRQANENILINHYPTDISAGQYNRRGILA
jgi:hypothetical protein